MRVVPKPLRLEGSEKSVLARLRFNCGFEKRAVGADAV